MMMQGVLDQIQADRYKQIKSKIDLKIVDTAYVTIDVSVVLTRKSVPKCKTTNRIKLKKKKEMIRTF